jgi:membrane associated rhomboid family serine protease
MFPLRDDRPTSTPPAVTVLLIAACVLVYLHEKTLNGFSDNFFIARYAMIPAHFRPITLVTSIFMHANLWHILGNMIFLWAFGKSLEDAMGHWKFFSFYMLCGIVAGIIQMYFTQYSRIPVVGASGAIAGIMGAYLLKFPRAYIHTVIVLVVFFTTTEIPAWFFVIYWFGTQLLSVYTLLTTTQVASGGVALFAHIGGFLTGMLLVTIMGTRNRYVQRRENLW